MVIFKCKMCGGDLNIVEGVTVSECEYCGTKQTLPKTNDDVISNLFNRANNLRLKSEFDRAAQIYEKIIEQNDGEAEAHWGLVLCKYGIEYVEDPTSLERIPTCHRTLFESVTADADYLAAIDYSDSLQQEIYEREARAIDKIQKDTLDIVKNEKPFDVFLCYKETDENGKRTVDSAIANDIYYQLTQVGFKVFYAPITLEDKLGHEYEPYIFAALRSSKVMLALGTKPEYFNAVWVKNEWARFLQFMKADRSKLLIPCYRDMDAYELPSEFSHLQSQDMNKIGFINDVIRGIKKVFSTEEQSMPINDNRSTIKAEGNSSDALLKRGYMALEEGKWKNAKNFFEQVLNHNAECAMAYVGKLMCDLKVKKQENLAIYYKSLEKNKNYQYALQFADGSLSSTLQGYLTPTPDIKKKAGIQSLSKNSLIIIAILDILSVAFFFTRPIVHSEHNDLTYLITAFSSFYELFPFFSGDYNFIIAYLMEIIAAISFIIILIALVFNKSCLGMIFQSIFSISAGLSVLSARLNFYYYDVLKYKFNGTIWILIAMLIISAVFGITQYFWQKKLLKRGK